MMEVESPHSFTIDLENTEEVLKPLPYSVRPRGGKRYTLPNRYQKFELEFYDVIAKCAEYIDKLDDTKDKIKYSNELTQVFAIRHKASAMSLLRVLIDLRLKK